MGETSMNDLIARHAVVIGAGMAGLSAAKAVAPYFEKVVVLDRDALPDGPALRVGTPQARHAHGLLTGGQKALEELFPGIESELAKTGGVSLRNVSDVIVERPGYDPFPRRDLGFDTLCLSRPLLESICRRRLRKERNVEFRPHCRVTELIPSSDNGAVASVRYESERGAPDALLTGFVVDASGRAAPTLSLLETIDAPKLEESEIGIYIRYTTAIFEVPDDASAEWKCVMHMPAPPDVSRGGLILPIEDNRWIVSLSGRHGDAPPGEIEGFLAFTKTLRTPTIHEALRKARPIGEVARYNLPCSVRRRFERLEHFPRGVIPIGDSICRFNPVFGQGMSVAAMEAVVLGKLLASRRDHADPLDGLAADYFSEIQACLESPWATAETDFVYPQTRGERPKDFAGRLQYGTALTRLMADDPEVHRTVVEVVNLVRPLSALREPGLTARVVELMKAAA